MRPMVATVTGPTTSSNWVRFDDWGPNYVSLQCNVTGTVNYSVQSTLDDPNSPTNPVATGSVSWIDSPDTAVVGATASKQSGFTFTPAWARILLNSGTGTVTATFLQSGNFPT